MTLNELYGRMSGAEIDERLALAIFDSPEYQEKMKKEAELMETRNLSPDDQAKLLMRLFKGSKS